MNREEAKVMFNNCVLIKPIRRQDEMLEVLNENKCQGQQKETLDGDNSNILRASLSLCRKRKDLQPKRAFRRRLLERKLTSAQRGELKKKKKMIWGIFQRDRKKGERKKKT